MTLRFSDFLDSEQLKHVNYYTYFPVLETGKGSAAVCKILPSDDAVSYILEFETESKKIISGEVNWFNEPLYKNVNPENKIDSKKISFEFRPNPKNQCIVLNLIDFCYGHSFVKLMNILDFYKEFSETHDIVVISFGYIKEFIPKEKVNIIHLDLSFSEAQKAASFKDILQTLREKYTLVDFAVLDAYKRFDELKEIVSFFNFFDSIADPYVDKKIITFNYRKGVSRSWGGLKQSRNVTNLFTELKKYYTDDCVFCVIGEKDSFTFPEWILDKRIEKFPNPILYEYHYILKHSVITIGLLGSHMLSASVLSEMTIHLTSEAYLRVAATDIVNHKIYSSESYFKHVYLEGNSTLSNYKPTQLAYKVMLLFLGKISLEYKEKCLLFLKEKGKVELQKEYIEEQHNYFKYENFRVLQSINDAKHNRAIRIKTYLSKFVK